MKNIFLYLIFSFTILFAANAQDLSTKDKKATKLFHDAEGFVRQRNFNAAIDLLRQAIDRDPNFVEAYLKLGSLHKATGNEELAKKCYVKAVDLKPNAKELLSAYFLVADFYFKEGNYEKAKSYFEKVLSFNPTDKNMVAVSENQLKKCDFGIEAMKHPLGFKPIKMDTVTINQFFMNGYPVLTADQQNLIYYKRSGPKVSDDEDIVISHRVNGGWSQPASISPKINTDYNEGAATLSGDGKTLVFASCNRQDGIGSCDLYISYKTGEDWSVPVNLGTNVNSNVWDSEPSISADGKTIYFSSERNGGVGFRNKDIWYTTRNDRGEWEQAKNLGKPINTEGNEVSPFIHANGTTLYFSSTFHPGMGGYDVFYTRKTYNGVWGNPVNVGYPINTHIDDATFFITPDFKKGYYSIYEKKPMQFVPSYIYEFDLPEPLKEKNVSTYAKGTVYDAVTKKTISASIDLIDLKTNQRIQSVNSDPVTGQYLIVLTEGSEYALYANKEGYLFKSISFNYTGGSSFNPFTLDIYLDPIKQGSTVVLNNIFFPSNSYQLEEKSKTELEKIVSFLKNNPKINIEFGGHTDDVGSDKDNQVLSEKRAKAVYDHLIANGIPAARLKFKGYGETKPVAPNDGEENRQKNRRIEFKIL